MPNSTHGEIYEIAKGFGPSLRIFDTTVTEDTRPVGSPYFDDGDNAGAQRADETTDSSTVEPALGSVTLRAYPFESGKVIASTKLVRSAGYDFAEKIERTLIRRLARKISGQCIVGTGVNEINGLLAAATAGLTTAADGDFTFSEMIDLIDSVDYRVEDEADGAFCVSRDFLREAQKKRDAGSERAELLYRIDHQWYFDGYPLHVFPELGTVATGNVPCLFGDPMAYKVRLVGEPRFYRSIIPTTADTIEFFAFWDADGDLADVNAIKGLAIK